MIPKPIDTKYKGYLFRSRLEARWAVFFEKLGIPFEYEPEGFELEGGEWYLPDFRLSLPCGFVRWIEVKPERGDAQDEAKAHKFNVALLDNSREALTVVRGDPLTAIAGAMQSKHEGGVCPRCFDITPSFAYGTFLDPFDKTIGCEWCDYDTPSGGDNPGELCVTGIECFPHKGMLLIPSRDYLFFESKLMFSARAARQARFEHGGAGYV